MAFILAWAGAVLLWMRLRTKPHKSTKPDPSAPAALSPLVSIIVPSRNEAKNLPPLLTSLKALNYPRYEIIVMDDDSTDQTYSVAESFGVQVVRGFPVPPGWNGKNWACHQAVSHAKGEYFLFTDADTIHAPESLANAMTYFKNQNADLLSAPPYHVNPSFWEKLLGPFHALILVATNWRHPRYRRLFAIGQYLLFSRDSYFSMGGHEAVKSQYPDDLGLANLCIRTKGRYVFYQGPYLFRVRMYATLQEFIAGWRRNFLAGIQQSRVSAFLEVVLVFCGLLGAGQMFSSFWMFLPAFLSFFTITRRQKLWGNFSVLGVFLFPFALGLYCWVTALAFNDFFRGNVLAWKGRSYTSWKN